MALVLYHTRGTAMNNNHAMTRLMAMIEWSDRLGSDELDEIGHIINLLAKPNNTFQQEIKDTFLDEYGSLVKDGELPTNENIVGKSKMGFAEYMHTLAHAMWDGYGEFNMEALADWDGSKQFDSYDFMTYSNTIGNNIY